MTDPDRRLAGKACRGDRRALIALYERHRSPLLGYLARTLGSRDHADDVFQEVWIKVLDNIHRYRETPGTFRAWLFRIATNAAVDRRRRSSVRAADELDAFVGDGERRVIDGVASREPGPDRRGESALLASRLAGALEKLAERQRSAVLLRHRQGLTYPEIARTLGVAEGTAKTLVHRGVLVLRENLSEWLDR